MIELSVIAVEYIGGPDDGRRVLLPGTCPACGKGWDGHTLPGRRPDDLYLIVPEVGRAIYIGPLLGRSGPVLVHVARPITDIDPTLEIVE